MIAFTFLTSYDAITQLERTYKLAYQVHDRPYRRAWFAYADGSTSSPMNGEGATVIASAGWISRNAMGLDLAHKNARDVAAIDDRGGAVLIYTFND